MDTDVGHVFSTGSWAAKPITCTILACVRLHTHCEFSVHLANNIQFIIAICTNYWITVYAKMHEAKVWHGRDEHRPRAAHTHSPYVPSLENGRAIAAPKSIIIRKCEMWCIRFRPAITVKLMRPKWQSKNIRTERKRAIAVSDHYCFPISAQTAPTKYNRRSMFYRARLFFSLSPASHIKLPSNGLREWKR